MRPYSGHSWFIQIFWSTYLPSTVTTQLFSLHFSGWCHLSPWPEFSLHPMAFKSRVPAQSSLLTLRLNTWTSHWRVPQGYSVDILDWSHSFPLGNPVPPFSIPVLKKAISSPQWPKSESYVLLLILSPKVHIQASIKHWSFYSYVKCIPLHWISTTCLRIWYFLLHY